MKRVKGVLMAATAALLLGVGSAAHAVPITGEIAIFGQLVQGFNLATATELQWQDGYVGAVTGSFADVGIVASSSSPVTLTSFSFGSLPVSPLWTIPGKASFDLTSVVVQEQDADHIDLNGTGTMHMTGFTDTSYQWAFGADRAGNILVAFSSTNAPKGGPSGVPEPTSLLLLGAGVMGLVLLRRRLACT